jgi:hypothetical protein
MSRCLWFQGAPVAAPFASSREPRPPLWDGAFQRITPGALSLLWCVLLSLPGGRA